MENEEENEDRKIEKINKIWCRRLSTRDVSVQVRLKYGCFTKETLGDIIITRPIIIAP